MRKGCGIFFIVLMAAVLAGCAEKVNTQDQEPSGTLAVPEEDSKVPEDEDLDVVIELADGVYTAEFETDSSMFHVSEACEGKGTLTVEKGNMTIHVSLASKNIVKLYCGLAENAGKAEDGLLLPTEDTVTYSDGLSEVVYGFDIPVPAIGEEFDLALIGKKGTWYDHKVRVTSPVPADSKP